MPEPALAPGPAGSNAPVIYADGSAIGDADVAAVRRGAKLLAPVRSPEALAALAAAFGWHLQACDALPGIARVPDVHPDVAAFEGCSAEVSGAFAIDGGSLPPLGRAVYEATLVDLFTAPVGEGRVVYLSYFGNGAEQFGGWRSALAR